VSLAWLVATGASEASVQRGYETWAQYVIAYERASHGNVTSYRQKDGHDG